MTSRRLPRAWMALMPCTLLAACTALPAAAPAPAPTPEATASSAPASDARAPLVADAAAPAAAPRVEPTDAAARRLLAYQEQLRQLPAGELGAELTRQNAALSASGNAPAVALELALVLAQTRNPADTQRALGLLEPIARSPTPEQQPWQGLARLLLVRVAEQRRLEDQLERQAGQLRESQRNVQQLNEKLEALKAIERSLNNRAPPPAASAAAPKP
ncbi:MAG: hypothetical protein QM722_19755 [Piscinibacter sp.]